MATPIAQPIPELCPACGRGTLVWMAELMAHIAACGHCGEPFTRLEKQVRRMLDERDGQIQEAMFLYQIAERYETSLDEDSLEGFLPPDEVLTRTLTDVADVTARLGLCPEGVDPLRAVLDEAEKWAPELPRPLDCHIPHVDALRSDPNELGETRQPPTDDFLIMMSEHLPQDPAKDTDSDRALRDILASRNLKPLSPDDRLKRWSLETDSRKPVAWAEPRKEFPRYTKPGVTLYYSVRPKK